MNKRFAALAVAVVGAALLVTACAEQGTRMSGPSAGNPENAQSACQGVWDPRTGVCIGG